MEPAFFKSPAELRKWFTKNHDRAAELWIGFYRKDSGRSGLSYPEAVDEALCFGWIDGVRRKLDEHSYVNRFSPRKARSPWSQVNIRRVAQLIELGRMMPPGLAAFERRDKSSQGAYSYEGQPLELAPAYLRQIQAHREAWKFYQTLPPWARRASVKWVMTAKREETRASRLAKLIACCERGERIPLIQGGSRAKE